jgi:hypothetical protein
VQRSGGSRGASGGPEQHSSLQPTSGTVYKVSDNPTAGRGKCPTASIYRGDLWSSAII